MSDVNLHKASVFDKRFEQYYRESDTQQEAYLRAEQDYKAVFGEPKYTSFDSFYQSYIVRQRKKLSSG